MKKQIRWSASAEVEYDPESPEFKEALESYKEVVDKDGDENTMLQHAVYNVVRSGTESMVEGVGYIKLEGRDTPSEVFSGITISDDYDELFFD